MRDSTLVKLGFIACENEPCLYKQTGNGSLSLILVYVDDILVTCQSKEDLLRIKSSISKSFECVDKGSLSLFLGMEIEREGELVAISLGHSQYIKDLLHAHGIENCRQAATPLNAGYQVACTSNQCKKIDPVCCWRANVACTYNQAGHFAFRFQTGSTESGSSYRTSGRYQACINVYGINSGHEATLQAVWSTLS